MKIFKQKVIVNKLWLRLASVGGVTCRRNKCLRGLSFEMGVLRCCVCVWAVEGGRWTVGVESVGAYKNFATYHVFWFFAKHNNNKSVCLLMLFLLSIYRVI